MSNQPMPLDAFADQPAAVGDEAVDEEDARPGQVRLHLVDDAACRPA